MAKPTVMGRPSLMPSLGAGVLVLAVVPQAEMPPAKRGLPGAPAPVATSSVTPAEAATRVTRNEIRSVSAVAGAATKLSVTYRRAAAGRAGHR